MMMMWWCNFPRGLAHCLYPTVWSPETREIEGRHDSKLAERMLFRKKTLMMLCTDNLLYRQLIIQSVEYMNQLMSTIIILYSAAVVTYWYAVGYSGLYVCSAV